jgi:DNA-binding transcriptional LysR family regulator
MDRFEALRTFIRVVDAGGISAAAESLGVAKSAVSRRLAELEGRLGVQLLQRTTRRISITDAGRTLHERAVAVLEDLYEAEAAVARERGALTGRLRIAAPLSFGLRHLGPALTLFASEHPDLRIDLDFNDRYVDLVAEGFDLGLRIGELRDSSLIARRLTGIRHTLCASPGFVAGLGEEPSPAALEGRPWLRYANQPAGALPYHDAAGRSGGLRLKIALSSTNGDFLRDAAVAGLGLTLLPNFIVYEALERGDLVAVMPDCRWRESAAYVIYPPTRHLSARVRRFIDFLVERFGDTPYWDAPCPTPDAPGTVGAGSGNHRAGARS